MDIQTPEMNGMEATRSSVEKQPLIIAKATNAMAQDKEAGLKARMDDYISKPLKLMSNAAYGNYQLTKV